MVGGVGYRVSVTVYPVGQPQGVLFRQRISHLQSEVAGEAVLHIRRKAGKGDAVLCGVLHLPQVKAHTPAAVEGPLPLIHGGVVGLALKVKGGAANTVGPATHHQSLVAQVRVCIKSRVVKAQHHIAQIAVPVRHIQAHDPGAQGLQRYAGAPAVGDGIQVHLLPGGQMAKNSLFNHNKCSLPGENAAQFFHFQYKRKGRELQYFLTFSPFISILLIIRSIICLLKCR